MSSLFFPRAFTGFGPNRLSPEGASARLYQLQGRRAQLRTALRQDVPRCPGVYGMLDGNGELIYVGKAKKLRARLLSYFRSKSRDPRAGRILGETRAIVWEIAPNEFAALLRELELIRRWRPRWNIQGQPHRHRRTFVCLGRRPAPYVYLSRRPPSGVLACWGPVFAGQRAREAVRRVNDWFGLRDCPQSQEMVFADQEELFPVLRTPGCLRHELGTCLGPCAAACTRPAYHEAVRAACRFLDGADRGPLETLQRDMEAAAASMAFERAAVLRDKLDGLQWLHHHLERVAHARRQHSCIYPVTGQGSQDLWYLIHCGWVAAAVPLPRDAESHRHAASAIETVFEQAHSWSRPAAAEEIDGVFLVATWFRRHPEEVARTLPPTEALCRCRAGADG